MLKLNHAYRLLMIAGALVLSACTVGVQDGMRVSNTGSTVKPTGYVTKAPAAGDKVRIQARNASTGTWVTLKDNVSINATKSWTTADGTDLFFWDAGSMNIPSAYWYSGTGGNFARLRAQWSNSGSWYNTLVSRTDWVTCFTENYNGEGNTLSYMLDNCFSHRGEAYIYTTNYREGDATCGTPGALTMVHGHYKMENIPSCARTIISNHMREKIDESMILMHYEINHDTAGADSMNSLGNDSKNTCGRQPGSDGQCKLGGFFGGHERYINRMQRHVMVYDYPWMPKGKIPAWSGSTWIPTEFQTAQVSPNGSCDSWTCDGWRSDAIVDSTPNSVKPAGVAAGTVCSYASVPAVASAVSSWHANGHTWTGGHFGTFDSPANPLFFTWHNAINDVWRDYKDCP